MQQKERETNVIVIYLPTQLFFPEPLKWQELKAYLVRQKEGPNLKRCPVWLDHGCREEVKELAQITMALIT